MPSFANIQKFLTEVRSELNKVKWPSQKEATRLTIIVLGVSIILGVYIGGVDLLLTKIIERFLR